MIKKRRKPVSPLIVLFQRAAARQGYTAYRLAKETGLGISTIYYLLSGQGSPTLATLEAVAEVLRIDISGKVKRKPPP